jgi:glycosyltransferase involved in cell wall biosynthesis
MKSDLKKVSIIIPVYNEEEYISEIFDRVSHANTLKLNKEIIIVDDGSSDKTRKILKSKKFAKARVILHEYNQGKSAALRTAFQKASGDIIIIQDADLEYNPDEYPLLLQPILDGADVVYGSRFMTDRPHRVLYFWHSIGNGFLTFLSNMFTNLNLSDMETCYKVFRKSVLQEVLPKLKTQNFGFEPEFTALISKINPPIKIYEVGISYSGRTYQEGKKINWRDGLQTIIIIIQTNLFYG